MTDPLPALSHLDEDQQPRMVDVGGKPVTTRTAQAQARVKFPAAVAAQLQADGYATPKGAVLTVANIAGVMGAKATAQLIPLCHPLALDKCLIAIHMEGNDALIDCTVACRGSTGVEMEALTGASVAALTLYDMCKAMSHDIVIGEIRLLRKTGGKSDLDYTAPVTPIGTAQADPHAFDVAPVDCNAVNAIPDPGS